MPFHCALKVTKAGSITSAYSHTNHSSNHYQVFMSPAGHQVIYFNQAIKYLIRGLKYRKVAV